MGVKIRGTKPTSPLQLEIPEHVWLLQLEVSEHTWLFKLKVPEHTWYQNIYCFQLEVT